MNATRDHMDVTTSVKDNHIKKVTLQFLKSTLKDGRLSTIKRETENNSLTLRTGFVEREQKS